MTNWCETQAAATVLFQRAVNRLLRIGDKNKDEKLSRAARPPAEQTAEIGVEEGLTGSLVGVGCLRGFVLEETLEDRVSAECFLQFRQRAGEQHADGTVGLSQFFGDLF